MHLSKPTFYVNFPLVHTFTPLAITIKNIVHGLCKFIQMSTLNARNVYMEAVYESIYVIGPSMRRSVGFGWVIVTYNSQQTYMLFEMLEMLSQCYV